MAKRLGPAATLLVLALAGTASLRARADDDPPPPVPLAVVVTDAKGHLVRNLTAADFEVIEDGQKRTIASLVARSATPRVIGLWLDEFHVSPGEPSARVRESLRAFVDTYLKAEDVVFVMKPLDPQTTIAPVTSLDAARERIAGFEGRKGDYTPRSPFEQEYLSTAPAMAERQRAQIVRSGLEAMAVAMRESRDAAKALVLITEGFASEQRDRVRAMTLRSTARAAALSNIPVYVIDPSGSVEDGPFNDSWRALAAQTGGSLVRTSDLREPLTRIGSDLGAQFMLRFESSGKQDGGFHGLELKARRTGAVLRAPTGYWAPFPPAPSSATEPRLDYSRLLTPHLTGLIQPWFRMSPGSDGQTRVTFLWSPRGDRGATSVEFAALTFDGKTLHEAVVPAAGGQGAGDAETFFDVPPGPLQISMSINAAKQKWLGREVRYLDVPKLEGTRPVITAVEFIRPRSLPEFSALARRADAVPTAQRDFLRQDRLLIRVRAFAGVDPAQVTVQLLNRAGQVMLDLPALASIDGASQFELAFARYPRGEYILIVRAAGAGQPTSQLVTVRLIG